MGQSRPLFSFIFVLFQFQYQYKILQIEKRLDVCQGFEPRAARWQVQMKPQSYGCRGLLSLWSVSSVSGIPSAPRRSHSSTSTTSRPCKRWRTFCKALTRTRRRTWSTSTGSLSTGESAKHRIPSVTSASESTKLKVGDRIQRCMVESSTFYEVYLLMITQFTVYVR